MGQYCLPWPAQICPNPPGSATTPGPGSATTHASSSATSPVSVQVSPLYTVTLALVELYPGQGGAKEEVRVSEGGVALQADTQFSPAKPVRLVIHGWGQATESWGTVQPDGDNYPQSFSELYWGTGMDVTVLGLHWVPREGWATCWFGTPQQCSDLQTRSAGDAAHTAAHLVASLARQHALQPAQLEIVGFSMGTVVASLTAKLLAEQGLGRPARLLLLDPCPTDQASVISTGDAELVEAVHTSSQGICAERPVGHLDFYPNGGAEQPCGSGPCLDINGNPDWVENHKRAVELYRESIGQPSAFPAWRCDKTYDEFVAAGRTCSAVGAGRVVMGEHSQDQGRPASGLYYLTTAGAPPFHQP